MVESATNVARRWFGALVALLFLASVFYTVALGLRIGPAAREYTPTVTDAAIRS